MSLLSLLLLLMAASFSHADGQEITANLRGSPIQRQLQNGVLCRITMFETLSVSDEETSSDEKMACIPIVNEVETDLDFDISLPYDFVQLYQAELERGKLLVFIGGAELVDEALVLGEELSYTAVTDRRYRHLQERHLIHKPVMTVAVLRISTSDSTPTATVESLRQDLFGNGANFVNQYKACSFNKLIWKLAPAGIMEVTVPGTISSYKTSAALITAVQKQMKADPKLNIAAVSDLADKVIMIVPPGTGSWAASAGVNHWRVQMNNDWSSSLTGTMHELGHTMGLLHANADGKAYADRSGYMGSGYTSADWPRKCFNGYNSWQFGWYSDKALPFDPLTTDKLVSLASFVDYRQTASGEHVLAKLSDKIYLQYNTKKGFNIDTEHNQNQVTITEPNTAGTERHGGLAAGEEYKYSNFEDSGRTLVIKACGTRRGANGADVMLMSIAMGKDICDTENTSRNPISSSEQPGGRSELMEWLFAFLMSLRNKFGSKVGAA